MKYLVLCLLLVGCGGGVSRMDSAQECVTACSPFDVKAFKPMTREQYGVCECNPNKKVVESCEVPHSPTFLNNGK